MFLREADSNVPHCRGGCSPVQCDEKNTTFEESHALSKRKECLPGRRLQTLQSSTGLDTKKVCALAIALSGEGIASFIIPFYTIGVWRAVCRANIDMSSQSPAKAIVAEKG